MNPFKLFTSKHFFLPCRWYTKGAEYGQPEDINEVKEYVCVKCGHKEKNPWQFLDTNCK